MAATVDARNEKVAFTLLGIVAGMVGLAFAAVPLYDLFCRVTGFGGTPMITSEAPLGTIDRMMTVRFDSNVDRTLAWDVSPARPLEGRIGEVETIVYTATNLTNEPVTGTALFNVSPAKTGAYFNKMECFCFTEQTLAPGETVEMPVTYFVDPALAKNSELDTIREITLSYTFLPTQDQGS